MLCKIEKQDAPVMNLLADQAFNIMNTSITAALSILNASGRPPCFTTSAMVQAMANHLVTVLLAHRQTHELSQGIRNLGELKKKPEVFQALVEDANELFAAVLRGIDPEHDYMLNMFRIDKKPVTPGGSTPATPGGQG